MPALLELRGVSKNFGGIEAVRSVSMTVARGEIVGLIGPNGAGKSTVVGLIAGEQRATSGDVLFKERRLTALPEYRRVRTGLVRILQHAAHLEGASVAENVALGLAGRPRRRALRDWWSSPRKARRARTDAALALLRQVGIEPRAGDPIASLSHWERRLLSLGRALASEPELVLLDEPLAGLSRSETEQFVAIVRRLRSDEGKAFLLVEHNLETVLSLCDRVVVLHLGQKIADDTPQRIIQDRRVRDIYLGDEPWRS